MRIVSHRLYVPFLEALCRALVGTFPETSYEVAKIGYRDAYTLYQKTIFQRGLTKVTAQEIRLVQGHFRRLLKDPEAAPLLASEAIPEHRMKGRLRQLCAVAFLEVYDGELCTR
jgi:hypothetical protein